MVSKCGCGRPVRYMTRTGDACNKYGRCNPDAISLFSSIEKPEPTIQELEAKVTELSAMVAAQERMIEKLRPEAIRWALIEEMMFAGNVSLNQDEEGGYSMSLDPVDNLLLPTFTGNSPEEVMDAAITKIYKS